MPSLRSLAGDPDVSWVRFVHCAYGGRRPKHTKLLTSLPCLGALWADCPGDHAHAPWGHFGPDSSWIFRTAEEAEYPEQLCERVAELVLARFGVQGSPLEARRAARCRGPVGRRRARDRALPELAAAAGRQPRGRLAPLVPERPLGGGVSGVVPAEGFDVVDVDGSASGDASGFEVDDDDYVGGRVTVDGVGLDLDDVD